MPNAAKGRKGRGGGRKGSKAIQGGILRQERKIARGEVAKAGRIIRRRGQWSVAAEAMGYKVGYDGKEGLFARRSGGTRSTTVQAPSESRAIPASSSSLFRPSYKRRTTPNGDCIVTFCQKIADIASDGSSNNKAFVVGGSRTESIQISPDAFGGQIATDARNYGYYKFPKMKFIASMNAPSTDGLSVGMAYIPDAAIASFQTVSASSIQQCEDYVDFTRKELGPVTLSPRTLMKGKTNRYDTELDTGTSIATRNSVQGVVYGFFNANDALSVTYGQLFAVGECVLMDRTSDYGFTFSCGASVDTLRAVNNCLAGLLRRANDKLDDQKVTDPARRNEALMRVLPRYASVMRHLAMEIRAALPGVFNPSIARVNVVDSTNSYVQTVDIAGHTLVDIATLNLTTFNPNGEYVGYKPLCGVASPYTVGTVSYCSSSTAPFVRAGTSSSVSSLVSGSTGGPSGTSVNSGLAILSGTSSTLVGGTVAGDGMLLQGSLPYAFDSATPAVNVIRANTNGTLKVILSAETESEKSDTKSATVTSSCPVKEDYVMVKPAPTTLSVPPATKPRPLIRRPRRPEPTFDGKFSQEDVDWTDFLDMTNYGKPGPTGQPNYTMDETGYNQWLKAGKKPKW